MDNKAVYIIVAYVSFALLIGFNILRTTPGTDMKKFF